MVRLGRLCLLTISGLLTGALLMPEGFNVQPSLSHRAFLIRIEITNYEFTPALRDHGSKEFRDMYVDVDALFNEIYNCDDDDVCPTKSFYGGVAAMTFSPGSVIANAAVVFNSPFINRKIAWVLFQSNAKNGTLQLNKDFTTIDNVIPIPWSDPPTSTTTTPTSTTTSTTTHSSASACWFKTNSEMSLLKLNVLLAVFLSYFCSFL